MFKNRPTTHPRKKELRRRCNQKKKKCCTNIIPVVFQSQKTKKPNLCNAHKLTTASNEWERTQTAHALAAWRAEGMVYTVFRQEKGRTFRNVTARGEKKNSPLGHRAGSKTALRKCGSSSSSLTLIINHGARSGAPIASATPRAATTPSL